MPIFPADILLQFSRDILVNAGVPAEDALVVAKSLVGANLRGHDSHGVLRLNQYLEFLNDGRYRPDTEFVVLDESPAILAADAGWGLGQVHAHQLLDRLIPKAQSLGIAAGTIRRCGHTGRLGEYAERAACEGLGFIGTVNSHGAGRRVAPPGGIEGRLSTNPLCIGAPTAGDPLILDMGTCVAAEGKVRVAFQNGKQVPEGWLLDSRGNPTTDPSVLYREPLGTILPLGGSQAYKGFGLALLLDALAGGLSGGMCAQPGPVAGVGNAVLFILLDTRRFGGLENYLHESTGLASFVRECPRAEGVESIMLPGDPERRTLQHRLESGIDVPSGTWSMLQQLGERHGVAAPISG